MIHFFRTSEQHIYAVHSGNSLSDNDISKLIWLFGEAKPLSEQAIEGKFVGPRREMITPWSTNAVEITQNMGISGILRIEEFYPAPADGDHDPMLQRIYEGLDQDIFTIDKQPAPILYIDDIAAYNEQEGLALSTEEIEYLNSVSVKLGRKLTDSEVFGFSQVNSEHCRHKIFGGQFIIDGEEKESSLFNLIKKTSAVNPNNLVSAYKDNVAFNAGPKIEQFSPKTGDTSDFFQTKEVESVISLKAETHNFPTTVEPFNGAATGTGGEIRDRLGGGKASLPIAGTAVYMTSYPRPEFPSPQGEGLGVRSWEKYLDPRKWLYQTPEQILIKASNGASDFGNKFGQPLICGSVLTFEHEENNKTYGYDKVIMLAGGVGFGKKEDALKGTPEPGEKVVVMGGDNYRIGMGGGAVSSVETGQYDNAIELNAVQRANPEMQKRVANVIRTLAESDDNPIVSIHDHGAGGHLNCLSELVETTGGKIDMSKLPVGDPTLSAKEIIGNESQERMGFLVKEKDVERIKRLAERERAPMYVVGETTGDMQLSFCPPTPQRGDCSSPKYETAKKENYNILIKHSKEMRRFSTEAESALWEMLRAKKLEDKFRRQHIIDDFIVDFVCLSKKLIVEVDGGYHNEPEIEKADKLRTEILEDLGYKLIRFTNEEVLANTDSVLQTIKVALNSSPLGGVEGAGICPINMQLSDFFGNPPRTVIKDSTLDEKFAAVEADDEKIQEYIKQVLQVESVACKDWLTNKVDRSVTGKIAQQQCVGELQLPLADLGAVALDYRGKSGIATSIGHAPLVALADPAAGSVMAIAEALTNIVWAPLAEGLDSVSLSANWMWPCKNPGEDARLYKAVEACSDFACDLGINIPTGKDSLSMTQKYGKDKVFSPGTVIISAGAEVADVKKIVTPVLVNDKDTAVYYIDFSFDKHKLGGSVLAQVLNRVGDEVPTVKDSEYFKAAFDAIQELINKNLILAGHDISEGGMITALLEMCFANREGGLNVNLDAVAENSIVNILFAENPGVLIQVKDKKAVEKILSDNGVGFARIAQPIAERRLEIQKKKTTYAFAINELRDLWYRSSYLLDRKQSGEKCAEERYTNYKNQPLEYKYPESFKGKLSQFGISPDRKASGVKAAIIRDKGTNGEREMAYALYLAGFDVKDVHMTDLASGRETLEDVNMIVFCGGFSNSDVLGSAKGWAGGFLYNEKAKKALDNFYKRTDTLSLGVCNGCQLMAELGLITPEHDVKPKMLHNDSHKFESNFVGLTIPENNSVMFGSLSGSKIGVWIAHGEGKFYLPKEESAYNVIAKYMHEGYPANPNGSDYNVAGICSADGRHLAMMPHPERAIFPWQCAHYPADRINSDQITPWVEAFVNARQWVEKQK
ncbi:phosphoribosylformylglycinamidine synthase [Paludibacter sp. 221]|nr:phosphoribosylformylglycinamidine synthase [Paludibacter sp. 221]NDV47158.1 phosphoribosylformylglycinamidine synthase [Paludibacter sp. 221]